MSLLFFHGGGGGGGGLVVDGVNIVCVIKCGSCAIQHLTHLAGTNGVQRGGVCSD